MRRKFFRAFLLGYMAVQILMLAGCATPSGSYGRYINLQFRSDSWDATTVDVYCDGSRVRSIRGITMGRFTRERVRVPWSCPAVRLRVRGMGNQVRWSDDSYNINEDMRVCFLIDTHMLVQWEGCR